MIYRTQKLTPSLFLHKLRTFNIELLEVPFIFVIQLMAAVSCFAKLKITGVVNADGFVVNQKWIHIFETTPTLLRIFVRVSLKQRDESYDCEKIQAPLCALNLSLVSLADETDCCLYYGKVSRWWSLTDIITKQRS